jgi:uncharacterized membrane protein
LKTKITLITYSVICILGLMVLLSRENLYMAAALLAAFLLLGHRELWSLARHRRMPVLDERVRNNLTGAMRTTGIFFFIASLVLILMMHFDVFENVPASLIVSGLLVAVGIVYVAGYHYYDRVQPALGKRASKLLNIFLATSGFSLGTIALSILLHNMIYALFGVEEAVFFILGLLVAPAVMALSLLGSLGVFVKGLAASFSGSGRE